MPEQRDIEIDELMDEPLAPGNTALPLVPEVEEAPAPLHRVQMSVVWGDLTMVEADVHVVGHYEGVLPAAAERALDEAITKRTQRGIITEHTRRGWVSGQLGEVSYFPSVHDVVRLGAVAGLGRHGTFSERRATQLYTSVFTELALLPGVQRAASVLIGAGAGNLSIDQAVRALIDGFADGLARLIEPPPLSEFILVEVDRLRAEVIVRTLQQRLSARQDVGLDVVGSVGLRVGGALSVQSAAVYGVMALAKKIAGENGLDRRPEADDDAGSVPHGGRTLLSDLDEGIRDLVCDKLTELADLDPLGVDRATRVVSDAGTWTEAPAGSDQTQKPVRVSVLSSDKHLRWAALSDHASIAERIIPRSALFDELAKRLHDPNEKDAARLPEWVTRMVIPQDFHAVINDHAPLVFQLDRSTASLHWELMEDLSRAAEDLLPLAVRTPIARQLRTGYSRVLIDPITQTNLRALVIGDPGRDGAELVGARNEAKQVKAALEALGVEVVPYIGAPGTPREEELNDIPPATRLEVFGELLSGGFDIVHYCGHGTLDADDPQQAGWVFSEGLITAQELAQLVDAPRIVVANACYSAVVSQEGTKPAPAHVAVTDPRLTPGLADEFLRAGALHYIGTAWAIHDTAGGAFAETFYQALLAEGKSVGAALCEARKRVHATKRWGHTWAAYQHYGDPTDYLQSAESARREG